MRRGPESPVPDSSNRTTPDLLGDRHLRTVRVVLRHAAQLIGLALHPLAQLAAEFLAALGRKGEADSGAHQAAEREDADGAERRHPGAAPLLETQIVEDVIPVDVVEVLPSFQALLLDVLH